MSVWKTILIAAVCIPALANAKTVIFPDTQTTIVLSNRDINRIKCASGSIKNAYFPEEKDVQVSVDGSNAFVKFLVTVDPANGKKTRVTHKTEFYFSCGGQMYELITTPINGDAKTVYLGEGKQGETALEDFSALPHEEAITKMAKRLFEGKGTPALLRREIKSEQGALVPIASLKSGKHRLQMTHYRLKGSSPGPVDLKWLATDLGADVISVSAYPTEIAIADGVINIFVGRILK